jgi:hypothetical protein
MKYSLNPYNQQSESSQKTARSECLEQYPTEKGILFKGKVDQLCRLFTKIDNLKMRA